LGYEDYPKMSIKRIMPIDQWNIEELKVINTLKALSPPLPPSPADMKHTAYYARRLAEYPQELKQYREICDWLEIVESNFRQALALSEFEPVSNPYGWTDQIKSRYKRIDPQDERIDPQDEWIFKGYLYRAGSEHARHKGLYTQEHVKLLILELYDQERRKLERLKLLYSSTTDRSGSGKRSRIPEHIRIEVWRRDSGKCARCGSRKNLEYDHIVPLSMGGSNTARNIELLCERCNRSKSDRIA
jgi:hypothetical protein